MIIAVDFDDTCVMNAYPHVGGDIGAAPVLRELVASGHKLILWTMRSGEGLEVAVEWFKENGIELFGINTNPGQDQWTASPKAYAEMYIDDLALGCPLVEPTHIKPKPHVDWVAVRKQLCYMGLLPRRLA